uniref:Sideroflexin-1 n=1 Tax=Astyanax mexicanus TaxID=7994 RepID=A0A8B9JCE9_ASTMX
MAAEISTSINIKEPRWDQGTFIGRAKHFFTVTDPRNILLTNEQLEKAHRIIQDYRKGVVSPGLTEDELWRAKYIFDSAFHPDTGEKMLVIGRMSAQHVSPLLGRFVPFAAVAAANCINIPLMRQRELKHGIPVTDENDNRLGESTNAAQQAISQVVISRILMASPGMAIPPFLMNSLEKKAFLKRFPWMSAPIQVGLVGFCLVFATPLCCALFPQKSSMALSRLEPELQEKIRASHPGVERVYFNKGL